MVRVAGGGRQAGRVIPPLPLRAETGYTRAMRPSMPRVSLASAAFALLLVACGPPRDTGFADRGSPRDANTTGDSSETNTDALDAGPRDVQAIEVGPSDVQLDPDAACTGSWAPTSVMRLPVDIIWVVDNSISMAPAIDQVIAGLNNFANLVGTRGLDYHVIMLSLRDVNRTIMSNGSMKYTVCIPMPLAGDAMCGNGTNFFQSSIDIRSTQPLEQFLGTLGQTTGYTPGSSWGGEPWAQFMRMNATKTIVVVSDDNSRLSAMDFEHFVGGANPFAPGSRSLPPGILDPSWNGMFAGYTFDGLYGWGSATDPAVKCTYPGGTQPPASGLVYTSLVSSTMGTRAQICAGASAWGPFFDAIATAVERTSRVSCDMDIPPPPAGMTLDPALVNVVLFDGTVSTRVGKVTDMTGCNATSGGWYYDNNAAPVRVVLCPASCATAQTQLRAPGSGVQVQFGCASIPG